VPATGGGGQKKLETKGKEVAFTSKQQEKHGEEKTEITDKQFREKISTVSFTKSPFLSQHRHFLYKIIFQDHLARSMLSSQNHLSLTGSTFSNFLRKIDFLLAKSTFSFAKSTFSFAKSTFSLQNRLFLR